MKPIPKLALVDNWRNWHKMASMRLAAVAAAFVGFIITNPTFLFSPVMFLPDEWKLVAAVIVTLVVFSLVGATRLLRKVNPNEQSSSSTEADPDCC